MFDRILNAPVMQVMLVKNNTFFSKFAKSSHSQIFFKIGVLKNFAIFRGKHLCRSLFKIKLQVFRYLKIDFFMEHLPWLPLICIPKLFQVLHLSVNK